MSKKKWIIIIAIAVLVIASIIIYSLAKPKLSSLPAGIIKLYLNDRGVAFYDELDLTAEKIINAIIALEENPDMNLTINWTVLQDYYESLRAAVKNYYHIK